MNYVVITNKMNTYFFKIFYTGETKGFCYSITSWFSRGELKLSQISEKVNLF